MHPDRRIPGGAVPPGAVPPGAVPPGAAPGSSGHGGTDVGDGGDGLPDGAVGGFDAVILAGGQARRLGGADKPGAVVRGRTLAEAVVAAAVDAAAVIVVGPRRPGLRRPPRSGVLRFVCEDPPHGGPVAGLRRGMAELSAGGAPWVAVLADDLPFLRARVLRMLLAEAGCWRDEAVPTTGAVLVDDAGRPQWLIGCWRASPLREALRTYRGGSLGGLLGPLRPVELSANVGTGEPPPWLDCDAPADLRRAREWETGEWETAE